MAGLLARQGGSEACSLRRLQDVMRERDIGQCEAVERKPTEAEQRTGRPGMGERRLQDRSEPISSGVAAP